MEGMVDLSFVDNFRSVSACWWRHIQYSPLGDVCVCVL